MRNSFHSSPRFAPRGLTLIELLVVVFIMMIFVAAAAPLVNPSTADRKIRETSRMVNAYIAEAKAHAAERNRPVGIAFDRAAAMREGARDSNLVSRLYLVEVPPYYAGDLASSTVQYYCDISDQNDTSGSRPPSITYDSTGPRSYVPWRIKLNFTLSNMLTPLLQSYLPSGQTSGLIPFTVRIGGRGSFRPGYVDFNATGTSNYYAWVVYGDPLYNPCSQAAAAGQTRYPYAGSSPLAPNSGGAYYFEDRFQIALPPVMTGDSPLELPTGAVVDLQFSGFGTNGTEFFDSTRQGVQPVVMLFGASGSMSAIHTGSRWSNPQSRVHLLVGSNKTAVEARDMTPANLGNRDIQKSTVKDLASAWVSVNGQTGYVTTSDNVNDNTSTADVAAAVTLARTAATAINTKGGR